MCESFQAYYGLFVRGKIQPNESVFLNAGTNYTVLAALNILQNSNVTVYVAVDNETQRQYLHENYPKVSVGILMCFKQTIFFKFPTNCVQLPRIKVTSSPCNNTIGTQMG